MILGMSVSAFTTLHVIISLIGIATGWVVAYGMLKSNTLDRWTAVFLATTVLTSVTGFFFPRDKILPSHIVGALSLVVLAIAILAFYRYRMQGAWRWIYVVTAMIALYLNVFVLVAQAFLKIGPLKALAPTGSEPPFIVVQGLVLIAYVVWGYMAVRAFRPAVR